MHALKSKERFEALDPIDGSKFVDLTTFDACVALHGSMEIHH
jgi:hypothetical protein